MKRLEKKFKSGETYKLRFGSKQANTIRRAAKKAGLIPNDYVKDAVLTKVKELD